MKGVMKGDNLNRDMRKFNEYSAMYNLEKKQKNKKNKKSLEIILKSKLHNNNTSYTRN